MGGLAARTPLPSHPSVERNPGPASRSCPGRWVPAAHLRAWRLQSQLRVPAPSRLPLRAPTLLAPQPLAQPPRLGKTKPGGGGGPGLRDRLQPRSPPRLRVGGFKEGDEGDRGCAPSAGRDKRITRPVKVRGPFLFPLPGILWWFRILHSVFTSDRNKTAGGSLGIHAASGIAGSAEMDLSVTRINAKQQ